MYTHEEVATTLVKHGVHVVKQDHITKETRLQTEGFMPYWDHTSKKTDLLTVLVDEKRAKHKKAFADLLASDAEFRLLYEEAFEHEGPVPSEESLLAEN